MSTRRNLLWLALVAVSLAALLEAPPLRKQLVPTVGRLVNLVRHIGAPGGTIVVERQVSAALPAPLGPPAAPVPAADTLATQPPASDTALAGDWPSFNRTPASQRYSPLAQINRGNVAQLSVICSYDTQDYSSFQTGPLVIDGALIGTDESDIYSIDPMTCAENWRVHENLKHVAVNRGAAYFDGMLYRGSGDGEVLAYDFNTGARIWKTAIADAARGESLSAAPIAWQGLVFIGNAGGDSKGVKGRMYALDAKSGGVVWEFYLVPQASGDISRGAHGTNPLDASTWVNAPGIPITGGATWTSYTLDPQRGELYVPAGNAAPDFATALRRGLNLYSGSVVVLDAKTGAYKRHFQIVPGDWHDWDVSNTPALIQTAGGKRLLAIAPKDGRLYGVDLDSNSLLYRVDVDTIQNSTVPFSTAAPVHFCPGARGGAEWNSPVYDPPTNLLLVGEVDWCTTVTLANDAKIRAVSMGGVWSAMANHNPYDTYGVQDSYRRWAGWIYASDADTGVWQWRAKLNYPVQGALTATAGGIVLFGDMGGNFYALGTSDGQVLMHKNLGAAVGGGVITYRIGGVQRVALAAGFTSILWPTPVTTGKIIILGLAAH